MPHVKFLELLTQNILEAYPNGKPTGRGRPPNRCDDARLGGPHFPEKVMKKNKADKLVASRSNCTYCNTVHGVRKTTPYRCTRCLKRLCIGENPSCFQLYHTKKNLRRTRVAPAQQPNSNSTAFETPASPLFASTPIDFEEENSFIVENQSNSISLLENSVDSEETFFDESQSDS